MARGGQWRHVVIASDKAGSRVYLDGATCATFKRPVMVADIARLLSNPLGKA